MYVLYCTVLIQYKTWNWIKDIKIFFQWNYKANYTSLKKPRKCKSLNLFSLNPFSFFLFINRFNTFCNILLAQQSFLFNRLYIISIRFVIASAICHMFGVLDLTDVLDRHYFNFCVTETWYRDVDPFETENYRVFKG